LSGLRSAVDPAGGWAVVHDNGEYIDYVLRAKGADSLASRGDVDRDDHIVLRQREKKGPDWRCVCQPGPPTVKNWFDPELG